MLAEERVPVRESGGEKSRPGQRWAEPGFRPGKPFSFLRLTAAL